MGTGTARSITGRAGGSLGPPPRASVNLVSTTGVDRRFDKTRQDICFGALIAKIPASSSSLLSLHQLIMLRGVRIRCVRERP